MRPIDLIVIHCSATKPSQDIGASDIDRWHRERGFSEIGYHYVIRRDGTREIGRSLEKMGAHAEGHNQYSIGVCLVGGIDEAGKSANNYTPAQWVTLQILVAELRKQYPKAKICGHRDLPNVVKDCPSFDVAKWLQTQETELDLITEIYAMRRAWRVFLKHVEPAVLPDSAQQEIAEILRFSR